jgi:hypothetical protein
LIAISGIPCQDAAAFSHRSLPTLGTHTTKTA